MQNTLKTTAAAVRWLVFAPNHPDSREVETAARDCPVDASRE
jgi:hypothetical protein